MLSPEGTKGSAGWAKQPRILSLWALLDLGILDLVIMPDSSLSTWDREWRDPFSLLHTLPPSSRDLTGSGWRSKIG